MAIQNKYKQLGAGFLGFLFGEALSLFIAFASVGFKQKPFLTMLSPPFDMGSFFLGTIGLIIGFYFAHLASTKFISRTSVNPIVSDTGDNAEASIVKPRIAKVVKNVVIAPALPDLAPKILLLGDANTGKTSFYHSDGEAEAEFLPKPGATTPGVSWKRNSIKVDNVKQVYACWDTAGGLGVDRIDSETYSQINIIFLFFDLTNADTFANIANRLQVIREKTANDMPCLLIATKSDLVDERVVTEQQVQEFMLAHNIQGSVEISNKTGANVAESIAFSAKILNAPAKQAAADASSTKTPSSVDRVKTHLRDLQRPSQTETSQDQQPQAAVHGAAQTPQSPLLPEVPANARRNLRF